MHIFFKEKIPKLNYIHLKLFFGGLVQNLQFFCKMSMTFESGKDIIFLET